MQAPKFSEGQQVRKRSSQDLIGIIKQVEEIIGGKQWYKVNFNGRILSCPESDLELYTGDRDVETEFVTGSFAGKASFSKLLTYKKLSTDLRNNLYSLFASKTEFHAYQYKPLLKFLDSFDQRLLIADEVGLGKTIESGLILIEQRARNPLDRVLIVCPASLIRKWRDEMFIRFDEEYEILDSRRLNQFLDDYEKEETRIKLRGIVSLPTLRHRNLQERLENLEPSLDLVIIDEAHHLRNPETLSHKLGLKLSAMADAMIMLTATPIHLGSVDLFHLLKTLRPDEFDNFNIFMERLLLNRNVINAERAIIQNPSRIDLCLEHLKYLAESGERERYLNNPIYNDVIYRLENDSLDNRRKLIEVQRDIQHLNMTAHILTRTRKREVQDAAVRVAKTVTHDFTAGEKQFYDAVTEYVRSKYQKARRFGFDVFVAMNYQRQVASCIPAMIEYYKRKFNIGSLLDTDETEMTDMEIETWLDDNGDDDFTENQEEIIELLKSCHVARGIDTKYEKFLEYLKQLDHAEPGRKIIIFSYFKKTLEYLSAKLTADNFKNLVIHGDYKPVDRNERMDRFREDPSVRILLSSEVGSEGLDFQFCDIMVNYDLPWNPMKVEQRIGRLDRFGQKSDRIIIINLVTNDTIEDKIVNRLYDRIKIFEESIGDLEPILGEKIKDLTREILSSQLTADEAERKIQALANAIETERMNQRRLEEESSKLIGFDEYFQQEMFRFTKAQNFISGDELRTFVEEFLEVNYPQLKLKKTARPGVYVLPLNDRLFNEIRQHFGNEEMVFKSLIDAYHRNDKRITITFNSEEANRDKSLEFINNRHPLIRLIKKYYDHNREQLFPVAKARIEYDKLTGDYYFYFIYLLEFTCARPEKHLETVIIRRSTKEILPQEEGEALMGFVKINGEDFELLTEVPQTELRDIYGVAKMHIHNLLASRERDIRRSNESLINDRIASLKKSIGFKIAKAQERLDTMVSKKGHPNIIRMNESRLRNLKTELDRKIHEIETGREVQYHMEEIAAGLIWNEV